MLFNARNSHRGVTLYELLIVVIVLGIVSAIAIPTIGNLVKRSKLKADIATVESLNHATYIYRNVYLGEDYFVDENYQSQQLIDILVDEHFLSFEPLSQTKGAEFVWSFEEHAWILKLDGKVHDDGNAVISEADIVSGTGGNSDWIIHYEGNDTSIIIPSSLGITVIAVPGNYQVSGNTAFMGKNLESVILPLGLEEIGFMAFRDNQLTSIIIPQTVTIIQAAAFRENPITEITIGSNVVIMDRVFGSGWSGSTQTTNAFRTAYETGGAGTYILSDGLWIKA